MDTLKKATVSLVSLQPVQPEVAMLLPQWLCQFYRELPLDEMPIIMARDILAEDLTTSSSFLGIP